MAGGGGGGVGVGVGVCGVCVCVCVRRGALVSGARAFDLAKGDQRQVGERAPK